MNRTTETCSDATAHYVQQLSGCQSQVYAYIYSLMGNAELAWDVLQETNAVLWQKRGEFDSLRIYEEVCSVRRLHPEPGWRILKQLLTWVTLPAAVFMMVDAGPSKEDGLWQGTSSRTRIPEQ